MQKVYSSKRHSTFSQVLKRVLPLGFALQFLCACYTPATQVILPKCLESPGDRVYVSHDWDVPFRKTKVDLEDAGEVTLVSSVPSPSRLVVGGVVFGLAGLAGWGYSEDGIIDAEEGVLMAGLATAGVVIALTGWHPSESVVDLRQESCSESSYLPRQEDDLRRFDERFDDYDDDQDYDAPPRTLESEDRLDDDDALEENP